MSKPRRLRYPRTLIERANVRLKVKMRRLRKDVVGGALTKEEGRVEGRRILEEHYNQVIEEINDYLEKRGFNRALKGTEREMLEAKNEALERWNRVTERL